MKKRQWIRLFIGIIAAPFIALITAVLMPLFVTHWYLKLEAEKAISEA